MCPKFDLWTRVQTLLETMNNIKEKNQEGNSVNLPKKKKKKSC